MRIINLKHAVPLTCALIGAIATIYGSFLANLHSKESQVVDQEKRIQYNLVNEARNQLKSTVVSNSYTETLKVDDKAYICAICDGIRQITEQLAGYQISSNGLYILSTTSASYNYLYIYSRTYVLTPNSKDYSYVNYSIRISYPIESSNEVVDIEVLDQSDVIIKGPFSIVSFKKLLNSSGFTELESVVLEDSTIMTAIRYDSNKAHLAAVGNAVIMATSSKDVRADIINKYDGLIINATGFDFRPNLINRIITSRGLFIYDPSKLPQKLLIKEGCGEYANNLQAAAAALRLRGVKKPYIINAIGTSGKGKADLVVPDETVSTILIANERAKFLTEAKVAFVLR